MMQEWLLSFGFDSLFFRNGALDRPTRSHFNGETKLTSIAFCDFLICQNEWNSKFLKKMNMFELLNNYICINILVNHNFMSGGNVTLTNLKVTKWLIKGFELFDFVNWNKWVDRYIVVLDVELSVSWLRSLTKKSNSRNEAVKKEMEC